MLDNSYFAVQSNRVDCGLCMKNLLRIAAVLSFGFCLAAGLTLLGNIPGEARDAFLLVAAGLFLVGVAFFAGALLFILSEKFGSNGKGS